MMGLFSSSNGPARLNAIKFTQSARGLPLPAGMGRFRIQQSLLWQNGFASKEVQGGKGTGKGTGFDYSADTLCGLCNGPISFVNDVWYNQSWLSNAAGSENAVVATAGIYTPQGASAFNADGGVAVSTSYSQVVGDAGSPSPTTLSGTDLTPMQNVPYGTALTQGQYSINPNSIGTFALTSVDNAVLGNTVYHGTITGGAGNALVGYTFVITGFLNPANNSASADAATGYICVASSGTTLTLANAFGMAETNPGTAVEPGNTYHFSTADTGKTVQLQYSFKLQVIRAQETDIIPSHRQIFVAGTFQPVYDNGVMYTGGDNPLNGIALKPTSTNPPTVTGTYHFINNGGQGGGTYNFAPGDVNEEVLITFSYRNNSVVPKGSPATLNFTVFEGDHGQSVWNLLTGTFPGEALAYSSTAYAGFNPMDLGGSASIPNIRYEVQTADQYGGGIVDCNPVQCIQQVLTNTVWGLGSGKTPFPIVVIDNGAQGSWGYSTGYTGGGSGTTNTGLSTGPVTVTVHASTGAGYPGLGGTNLGTITVNTPVFNQVVPNYPITGFSGSDSVLTLGFLTFPIHTPPYKMSPMVAVETTSNSTMQDIQIVPGTTSTFIMDMTGTLNVATAGTYTLYVNYANYSSWALYIGGGATLLGGSTPPSATTISQGVNPPFPITGPTTGYTKFGEQSFNDGSHPIPSTIYVHFATAGSYNYEALYTQTSPISAGGQANGYFQITWLTGQAPKNPNVNNVGFVLAPGQVAGSRQTGTTAWAWFAANGFFISPLLDKQESAASTIGKWLEAGMCAAFMSEGLMKLVPYGDTSVAGNGATWLAPFNYIVALDDTAFMAKDGEEPVKISRTAWQDGFNYVQVKYANRQNQYSGEIIPESDQAAIDRFGLRIEDPVDWDFITTLVAATFAANMRVKRAVNIRNTFEFMLPFTYSYLEPMDLALITTSSVWAAGLNNANLGIVNLPIRIQKIVDDPTGGLKITAEDYPWGVAQPILFNKGTAAGEVVVDLYEEPGNTEAILIEATSRLTGFTGNQIWMGAAGASSKWGGCNIWVSSDGTKYKEIGTITNAARFGTLAFALATDSDPDIDNEIVVNLVENSPALESGTTTDADNGNTLCFVDGELVAYSTATLTGQSQFTLSLGAPSIPGYIRRGLFGSSISAHAVSSLFMRLDDTIFKFTYDPTWAGQTIFFKFASFNAFKNETQDLSEVTAIPFAIPGLNPGTVEASSGLVLVPQPVGQLPPPPHVGVGRIGWTELSQPGFELEDGSGRLLLEDGIFILMQE
jgi:Putative phage tail protein